MEAMCILYGKTGHQVTLTYSSELGTNNGSTFASTQKPKQQ